MSDQLYYDYEQAGSTMTDSPTRKTVMLLRKAKNVDWVDAVVKAATVCNQIFQRRACNLCHIYVDRQIEFEQRQETIKDGNCVFSPVERLFMQMDTGLEVERYRQFLFDEASVVNHATDDDERDDDEDGLSPQQHQEQDQPSILDSLISVDISEPHDANNTRTVDSQEIQNATHVISL